MMAPTVAHILDATAARYGTSRFDLVSQRRHRPLILPRQISMYLARQLTPLSLPAIGRLIGGRDHSTVMHGVEVVTRLIETTPAVAEVVDDLASRLVAELPGEARERDPLLAAIEIATGARHPTVVAVDEIAGIARALVGYGRAVGAVTVEDEETPDPERLPIETRVTDTRVLAAIDALRASWIGWEQSRFSAAEKGAFGRFQTALKDLFTVRATAKGA